YARVNGRADLGDGVCEIDRLGAVDEEGISVDLGLDRTDDDGPEAVVAFGHGVRFRTAFAEPQENFCRFGSGDAESDAMIGKHLRRDNAAGGWGLGQYSRREENGDGEPGGGHSLLKYCVSRSAIVFTSAVRRSRA